MWHRLSAQLLTFSLMLHIIPLLNNNNKYLVSAQYQYRQISKFMISESELKKVDQCISNTLVVMTLWQMFACTHSLGKIRKLCQRFASHIIKGSSYQPVIPTEILISDGLTIPIFHFRASICRYWWHAHIIVDPFAIFFGHFDKFDLNLILFGAEVSTYMSLCCNTHVNLE